MENIESSSLEMIRERFIETLRLFWSEEYLCLDKIPTNFPCDDFVEIYQRLIIICVFYKISFLLTIPTTLMLEIDYQLALLAYSDS